MQLGYRDLNAAESDKDLEVLSDDPEFQTLIASANASGMSRDEGWHFDLNLMAREINRRGYAPFHSISHQEFDRRVSALDSAIPTLSDMQIIVAMMKLTAAIGDGHTMIYAFSERPEFLRNIPVEFALFQEGLFVVAAESRFEDLLGARVIQFGDRSTQEVLQGLDPIISRDNENSPKVVAPMRMRNLPLLAALGLIPDPTQVVLTVRDPSGKLRTVNLRADSDVSSRKLWDGLPETWKRFVDTIPEPLPLYLRNPHKDYWYEYLPESKTVYLQWNHVHSDSNEPIGDFFDRISSFIETHAVDKLAIDLRWNNGGDSVLIPPVLASLIRDTKIDQPGEAVFDHWAPHFFSSPECRDFDYSVYASDRRRRHHRFMPELHR